MKRKIKEGGREGSKTCVLSGTVRYGMGSSIAKYVCQ